MSKELFIGPFPNALTKEEREEFLTYFGAVSVKHIQLKHKPVYAIAV